MLRHFPKRITRNIGNDDRRPAICRRPARTGTRSNWQLLHLLSPSFGKTWARDRIQMNAIRQKQQDRSERAATVIFDNHAQRIQNLLEDDAGGDHFEKALFPGEQRLPALALGNVYRSTGITFDFAGRTENGPAHTLNMLNRSVRQRDPELDVKTSFLAHCFIETSLNKGSIFRMSRFQEQLERWLGLLVVETKDPEMLR